MTDIKRQNAELLRYQLLRLKEIARQRVTETGLEPKFYLLSQWQSERLAHTHADLLQNPRYQPAMEFFLEELYGPKDFTRRERDIERVYSSMVRLLPANLLHTLAMAIELNALSYELDARMVHVLAEDLGIDRPITEQTYAQAYRRCNNYAPRKRQIELIGLVGEDLDKAVASPLVYMTLRLVKKPAQLAGFGKLQEFLEQGFRAFRHTRGARVFLDLIVSREMEILERLHSAHPRPFTLPTG